MWEEVEALDGDKNFVAKEEGAEPRVELSGAE